MKKIVLFLGISFFFAAPAFASMQGDGIPGGTVVYGDPPVSDWGCYVSKQGSNGKDGSNWHNAKLTVRACLEARLKEEGAGGQKRTAGDIYLGLGNFKESCEGLSPSQTYVMELTSNIRFHGSGVPLTTGGGGTIIELGDNCNRHLFDHRDGFTDWAHNVTFMNLGLYGNKANNVGNYDIVRMQKPGGNAAFINVQFRDAPRTCLDIDKNAVNLYLFNVAAFGCDTHFFKFTRETQSSTTNIVWYGVQFDNSGNEPVRIDDNSNGPGNFAIYGMETEAQGAGATLHDCVICYYPTAGDNALTISINELFAHKTTPGVNEAVIKVFAGSGGDPEISWKNVIANGYDRIVDHVDRSIVSVQRTGFIGSLSSYTVGQIGKCTFHFFEGDGDPNGDVTADPCAMAFVPNGTGNKVLWMKETGTGTNTGWVAK